MPGNLDGVLFAVGFIVGAGCVIMLGTSLLEDYDRRVVVPATVVTALFAGVAVGWAMSYFLHWSGTTP